MQRFIKSYLTVAAVIILAANLVLIILYGRQFRAAEATDCIKNICEGSSLPTDLVLTNTLIIGLLLAVLFAVIQIRRAHTVH